MSIAQNLLEIQKHVPDGVVLIAISKTKPEDDIVEAYGVGQRHFGENKVQELVDKYDHLPKDIFWHFIGHLQTNKVKYIAPFVHLIHAVDSEKLLRMIQKEGEKNNRVISCLLQVKVAQEDSKFGVSFEQAEALLIASSQFSHVKIEGLMVMATNTEDQAVVRAEFKAMHQFFTRIKSASLTQLSMGMSNDWPLAVEEGSTMVRVGSSIFGQRIYK